MLQPFLIASCFITLHIVLSSGFCPGPLAEARKIKIGILQTGSQILSIR
jgi:hypothetical protein